MKKQLHIETEAIHGTKDFLEKGSLNVPIYQNSTYAQKTPGVWENYTYTRTNNPTEEALRHAIAVLEGGTYGVAFSSGLAAINAVTELFSAGDHIVSTADIYGGTHRLFTRFSTKNSLKFSFVDTTDLEAVKASILPETKLVYVETPSNPLLTLTDLKALAQITKEKGILLAVDNTMATPFLQRPLELGADIVIQSTSKYISGHTNVVGGAVVVNDEKMYQDLKFIHKATGGNPGPFDCYLTLLGIKTLGIRMKQHGVNAMAVARFLQSHKRVKKVYYPGLEDHPQHDLAKRQMRGFGGIVSCDLEGGETEAHAFIKNLNLFALSISFGSVTSIISHPAVMSHKEMKREERLKRGFSDSLIRLALGIENDSDIIDDLDQSLARAFA